MHDRQKARKSLREPFLPLPFYIFGAWVVLLPASLKPGKFVPGNPLAGTYDHLWLFWWMGKNIPGFKNFLHTDYLLYPQGYDIFDTFHNILNELITAPLHIVLAVPSVYLLTVLLSLAGAGWLGYLLARRITGDWKASLTAGLFYMFSPLIFSLIHNGESEMLTYWLIPLLGLCLFSEGFWWRGVAGGAVLSLIAVGSWYYFVVAVLFSVVFFVVRRLRRQRVLWSVVACFGICAGFVVPFAFGTSRHMHEPRLFESDMPSVEYFFFPQSPRRALYERPGEEAFTQLYYLGWVMIVCAILGALRERRRRGFWLAVLLLTFILSLGKEIRFRERAVRVAGRKLYLPAELLYRAFPYFRGIHKPYRLSVMTSLSLAILSAMFLKGKRWVTVGAGCAYLLEFLFVGLRPLSLPLPASDMQVPAEYDVVRMEEGDFAVVEYPFFRDTPVVGRYLYYQTYHQKKLVGPPAEIFPPFRDIETRNFVFRLVRALEERDRDFFVRNRIKFFIFHSDILQKFGKNYPFKLRASYYLSDESDAGKLRNLLSAFSLEEHSGDGITVFSLY